MGACNFIEIAAGKDARSAFNDAVESARYEHGHSYTGSIAEKSGYMDFTAEIPPENMADTIAVLKSGDYDCPFLPPWVRSKLTSVWNNKRDKAVCVLLPEKNREGENLWLFCGMAAS